MVQFVKFLLCKNEFFNVTSGFQVKNQSTAMWVSNSSMQTGRSPNFTGWTSLIKFLSHSPVRVSISLIHTQTNQDIWKTTMIIVLLHPYTAVLIQGQTYPLHSQTPRENNIIRFVFYFCFYMTVQKNSLYWFPSLCQTVLCYILVIVWKTIIIYIYVIMFDTRIKVLMLQGVDLILRIRKICAGN